MRFPRWLPYAGIVAFYVTLIVLGRIWLAPMYAKRYEPANAATMRRWMQVRDRVVFENDRLRKLTVRDSLFGVVPKSPGLYIGGLSDSVEVIINQPGAEPRVGLASLREIATREAGQSPEASIAIVGVPMRYGAHPDVRQSMERRMFFSGAVDGRPYCIVSIAVSGSTLKRHPATLVTRTGALGQCAFWARYGKPGPQIQRWLDAGGGHFAGSHYAAQAEMLERLDRLGGGEQIRMRQRRFLLPLAGQACLGGREDVCAHAVSNPGMIYGEPDSAEHFSEWDTRLGPGERTLLAHLEKDFGAQRFERFWTSDKPFEGAFEEAFDTSLGAWVRDFLEPYGNISRGARLGGDSVLLTALLLGICVGLALMTSQRRRV